jgi:nucleotide-binding universal stress UspA family protein
MTTTAASAPVLIGVTADSSRAALELAADEAARRRSPLRLLHAYSAETSYPWGYGYPLPAGVLQNAEEVARANAVNVLEDAAEHVRGRHTDLAVTTTLARGSAAGTLVLASRSAGLLVVGRRAHRHPWPGSLGSVSLAVAAHAECPVLVVADAAEHSSHRLSHRSPELTELVDPSGGGAEGRADGHVVVGLEDSPECVDAVGFAFGQAASRGLPLTAVHSWWVDPSVLPIEGAWWAEVPEEDPVAVDALLAPWTDRYPEVAVQRVLARGRPAHVLLAAGENAELLVVGSRGRGGFTGLLLGSVSREILQHAPCPVAVVRAGQVPLADDLVLPVRD